MIRLERALCRDYPNLFIEGDQPKKPGDVARAKAVYHHCPIERACRDWILDLEGDSAVDRRHWVFGGMDPAERVTEWQRRQGVAV